MNKYILLCENRIQQLCPNQEFPICEKHLNNTTELLQLHLLKQENHKLKNLCVEKDKVI